jgi:hypothetical protein
MKTIIKLSLLMVLAASTAACATFNTIPKSASIGYKSGEAIGEELGKKAGNSAIGATIGTLVGVSAQAFIYKSFNNSSSDSLIVKTTPELAIKRGSIYTVSGIGLGLTGGTTRNILKPKISTTLGLDFSLGKGGFFLYPSVELLVFRYDQQISDADYSFSSQSSRATYSTFTLSLGFRKNLGNFSIYQFAGLGGALVKEPRIIVDVINQRTMLSSRKSSTWAAKGGIGVDYNLGQFVFFTEGSHLHHFKSLQDRKILIFPAYIGVKSNISGLFKPNKLK